MLVAIRQSRRHRKGFTIIELMVVLAVVGVLIGLSVFMFGTWRENVAKTEVINDLKQVAAAMKSARNFDNTYPLLTAGSTFDQTSSAANTKLFVSSSAVQVTYVSGDAFNYCIQGVSIARPQVHYFIDTLNGEDPVFGTCTGGQEDPSAAVTPGHDTDFYVGMLSTGGNTSCAVASDSKAYCWGENGYGQVGLNNTTSPINTASTVVQGARPDTTAKSISTSGQSTCLVGTNDQAYCFGHRLNGANVTQTGQLGDGNSAFITQTPSPVAVSSAGALAGGKAKSFSVADIYACSVGMDSFPYCWGLANSNWQLGSSAGQTYKPIALVDNSNVLSGKTVKKLTSATWHTCAIASDAWVYCWGSSYRIGITNPGFANSGGHYIAPIASTNIPAGTRFVDVDAVGTRTCAVSAQNQLYCWGQLSDNTLGTHLGNFLSGTNGGSDVPVAVNLGELPDSGKIRQVALGQNHICVISINGKVYCAGNRDGSGKLGDALLSGSSQTAVQVAQGEMPSSTTALYIQAGDNHTCVLASNGKVYCWGSNNAGQLGNGTTTDSAVPVEVKTLPALSV